MSKRPSLPRRIALALMEHSAWVLPSARGCWGQAMQRELPQIKNDLEALAWAGGCVAASYVERGRAIGAILRGAVGMPARQRMKIGLAGFVALAAIGAASWWAGQRPYLTPGNHQVFREGSNFGALAGFLVFIAAAIPGLAALAGIHDRKFHEAARAGRVCAVIIVPYLAALALVSLLTPGTLVNIGDSYCYDLWCLGVNQVKATPSGRDILYEVRVTAFVDSSHTHRLPAEAAKSFFYVLDDHGQRYPLLREKSFVDADVTVQPGASVESSFAFLAPLNARKLYLMGDDHNWLPWVYLYFGSDISLFHRPALLRIL
jgi:hypothetical protein